MKRVVFVLLLLMNVARADVISDLGRKLINIANPDGKQPILVIGAGKKLNIGGDGARSIVEVFGVDQCPRDWLGAPTENNCIVLDKPSVLVRYVLDRRAITETWEVRSADGQIILLRPNGVRVSDSD